MSTTTTTRTISPKNPSAPASAPTLALIARFEIPIAAEGLLQGDASAAIDAFFEACPEAKARYDAERAERRSERFVQQRDQYVRAAAERLAGSDKDPATPAQVAGLMRRAYAMPSGDRLRGNILSALAGGMSAAQANVLIRKADGTFVEKEG